MRCLQSNFSTTSVVFASSASPSTSTSSLPSMLLTVCWSLLAARLVCGGRDSLAMRSSVSVVLRFSMLLTALT